MRIPSAALRLVNQRTVSLVQTQTRNARIVNARFFQSRVEPRIVDKYKEKLEKKIKRCGVDALLAGISPPPSPPQQELPQAWKRIRTRGQCLLD